MSSDTGSCRLCAAPPRLNPAIRAPISTIPLGSAPRAVWGTLSSLCDGGGVDVGETAAPAGEPRAPNPVLLACRASVIMLW